MASFNQLFQSALAKLTQAPVVKKTRNVLESAKQSYSQWQAKPYNQLVKNIGSTIQPAYQTAQQNVSKWGQQAKQRYKAGGGLIQYSPFGLINEAPRNASVLFGKNRGIAEHSLRGALDPLGIANKTSQYLNPSYTQQFQPTTKRERTARKVGQAVSGTIATAPIGGSNYGLNVGRRAIQGSLLGTGRGIVGNLLSGNSPTQDLDQYALEGLSDSWQLSFTNLIADKIGSKISLLKGTTSNQLDLTGQLLKNTAKMGLDTKSLIHKTAKDLFLRAVLETGVETTWFSALDEDTKDKFVKRWWDQLPGNFLGNMMFSSLAFGKRATIDTHPQLIMDAKIAFKKTLKKMFGGSQYSQKGAVDPKVIFGKQEPLPWEKADPNSPKRDIKEPFSAKRPLGSYSQDPTFDNPLLKQAKEGKYKFESQEEIDRIVGLGELHEYETGKRPIKKLINSIMKPLNNAPPEVKSMLEEWNTKLLRGKVVSNNLASSFKNIDDKNGWKLIQYMQDPTQANAKRLKLDVGQYNKDVKKVRSLLDFYYEQATKRGIDIGYRKNYVPQLWKETPGQIEAKVRGLGTKPSFAKERRIPTYAEGIDLGLTPKYTHPGQLIADYRYKLSKAIANKKLMAKLLDTGYLVPSSEAPADWKQIKAPYLPKATRKYADVEVVSNYSAPPTIAESLNSIFDDQTKGMGKFLELTSVLSRKVQEIALTGGIGPLNSFTIGQMIKEFTGFRVKSPVTSFVRSWSKKATDVYFTKNQKYLVRMASEGITPRVQKYDDMYKNVLDKTGLREQMKEWGDDVLSKATFQRFMPQLELNMFKDTFDQAVKGGMAEKEASELAGKTVKNWFGMVDTLSRPKLTKDTISTFLFAPTFRSAMVSFWGKNVMSVLKPLDKSYKHNRRFIAGATLTYIMMNALNKKLTGHGMKDNKRGKALSLEIPKKDNRSLFIPLLPSVMTIPRSAYEGSKALLHGDVGEFTNQASRFMSTGFQTGTQLLNNQTWYGGPIYDKEDTAGQKISKLAGYGVEQLSPGYISNAIAVAQGRKTPAEGFMGGMEFPIYPSRSSVFIRKDYKEDYAQLVEAGKDENNVRNFVAYQQKLDDLSSVKYKKQANALIAQGKDPEKVLPYVTWLSDMDELDKKLKKISRDGDLTLEEKKKKAKPIIAKLKKLQQQTGN